MDENLRKIGVQRLSGTDWTLSGWWPQSWIIDWPHGGLDNPTCIPVPALPASVPGAVQADLERHGLIQPLEVGFNSADAEWVEHRDWVFEKRFRLAADFGGRRILLRCLGLDYSGHIEVNGKRVRSFEGSFVPIDIDVTRHVRTDDENLIRFVFYAPLPQPNQYGSARGVRRLRPRFTYAWDFCARAAPIGIWDDVYLKAVGAAHLLHVLPTSVYHGDGQAALAVEATVQAARRTSCALCVTVRDRRGIVGQASVDVVAPRGVSTVAAQLDLSGIEPWWPNGMGAQKLYRTTVELISGADVLDSYRCAIGFKAISVEPNESAPAPAPPYTLCINGRQVFLKCLNWVALSNLYGAVSASAYRAALGQFRDAGCNAVRVWGGGILEKEAFYRLCDRLGIMVIQEFPQSNGATDGIPPNNPAHLRELGRVAEIFIRRRGHHACHIAWTGGNELKALDNTTPVGIDHPNIRLLADLCARLDPHKWFWTSSPSGPVFYAFTENMGKQCHYNVHGPWGYLGPAAHYEHFNSDDCLMRMEMGAGGASDLVSLEYLAGGQSLWPPSQRSRLWSHHGYGWAPLEHLSLWAGTWDDHHELPSLVKLSQYIQYEAVRYALEASLRRAFACSGVGIWTGGEPFLNAANCSLIDALGHTKMAFSAVQRAFCQLHVSLRYDSVAHHVGAVFQAAAFVHGPAELTRGTALHVAVRDVRGETLRAWDFRADGDRGPARLAGALDWQIADMPDNVFFVDLHLMDGRTIVTRNTYAFTTDAALPFAPFRRLPSAGLDVRTIGPGVIEITNSGPTVAIGAALHNRDHSFALTHQGNYATLFPGECAIVTYRAFRKRDRARPTLVHPPKPDLYVDALNASPVDITQGPVYGAGRA